MKLVKIILISVFANLFSLSIYAQWKKAEIITISNDTLAVKVNTSKLSADELTYYELNTSKSVKTMSSSEIQVVFLPDATFRSFTINGSKKLAKRLFTGSISLYRLSEEVDTQYLLVDDKYDVRTAVNDSNYKEQFKEILNCVTNEEIDKSKYYDYEMVRLISRYSACSQPDKYLYVKEKRRLKLKFLPSMGASFYSLNDDVTRVNINRDIELTSSAPSLTIGFEMWSDVRRFQYGLGLFYAPVQANIEVSDMEGSINYNFFEIPFSLGYMVNDKLTIALGATLGLGTSNISNELNAINSTLNNAFIDFGGEVTSVSLDFIARYKAGKRLYLGSRLSRKDYAGTGDFDVTGTTLSVLLQYNISRKGY